MVIYALTFVVAVTVDWAIPHLMPGNPVNTLMGRIQIQDPKVAHQVYTHYERAFNLDLPLWKQYWYFWVVALPRRPRSEHPPVPDAGHVDHHPRDPVHAGAARAGDRSQLVRGQQVRRAGGAPKAARQHAASARLCTDRDAVHVARDPARLGAGRHAGTSSRSASRTTRRRSAASRGPSSRTSRTTGSCRSSRCSSSPSAAGRSECGT